jgi:hypothetical protein
VLTREVNGIGTFGGLNDRVDWIHHFRETSLRRRFVIPLNGVEEASDCICWRRSYSLRQLFQSFGGPGEHVLRSTRDDTVIDAQDRGTSSRAESRESSRATRGTKPQGLCHKFSSLDWKCHSCNSTTTLYAYDASAHVRLFYWHFLWMTRGLEGVRKSVQTSSASGLYANNTDLYHIFTNTYINFLYCAR